MAGSLDFIGWATQQGLVPSMMKILDRSGLHWFDLIMSAHVHNLPIEGDALEYEDGGLMA